MNAIAPEQTLQLHDIHLPAAASWWPPAPGWWLLAIICLLLIGWLSGKFWQWQQWFRYRRNLIRQFDQQLPGVFEQTGSEFAIGVLSQLKRLALTLYPDDHPAALTGNQWQHFLQQHGNLACPELLPTLEQQAYSPNPPQLSKQQQEALLSCCRQWCRQAIDQHTPEHQNAV